MKTRLACSLLSSAMALHLLPTAALAQPPQSAAPAASDAEVEAAYQRGTQAFRDRRYGEALVAFELVTQRRPTPEAFFALGQACRAVARYVEAVGAFERFLASPPQSATPQLLGEVREQVAQMRRSFARVTIEVTPPQVSLLIDARPVTPSRDGLPVNPGAHVIELSAPGYRPERREVRLDPGGQSALTITLQPVAERPRLVVEPSLPRARVSLDGRELGLGRVELNISPGHHLIEITAEDHQPFRRALNVGASGTTRVDATLLPRSRPLPGWVLPTSIAGGVVLVAGAVALGVALSSSAAAPPLAGNIWDSIPAP